MKILFAFLTVLLLFCFSAKDLLAQDYTQLGIGIDSDLCYDNMKIVLDTAKYCDNFVRMDMEGSAYTQKTIDIFKKLRKDYDNVGIVMQSYLYRTEDDIDDLLKIGSNFRLCKGAYREPKDIAFLPLGASPLI